MFYKLIYWLHDAAYQGKKDLTNINELTLETMLTAPESKRAGAWEKE